MLFGALGDIHGDFAAVERVMRRHPAIPYWLSIGDVADADGQYPAPIAPLFWIKGNNEDFDFIEACRRGNCPRNLHYVPNGVLTRVSALAVVGLGGTFAPKWYDTAAASLPGPKQPGGLDDKRRHFVKEDVEACKSTSGVDVFLTHEAPRPYFMETASETGGNRGRRLDAGKTPINEVLSRMRPRLHLFGHHHRFTDTMRQGVKSIGLDVVSRSYLLVDERTLEYEQLET